MSLVLTRPVKTPDCCVPRLRGHQWAVVAMAWHATTLGRVVYGMPATMGRTDWVVLRLKLSSPKWKVGSWAPRLGRGGPYNPDQTHWMDINNKLGNWEISLPTFTWIQRKLPGMMYFGFRIKLTVNSWTSYLIYICLFYEFYTAADINNMRKSENANNW